jgi:dihydrofolate reductase
VAGLKADATVGRILIPGSISIVQQLLAAGLVDELSLLVHPVAARSRKLFDDGDASYHLKLVRSEVFPTGVVWLTYQPAVTPGAVGYDDVKGLVPDAPETTTGP